MKALEFLVSPLAAVAGLFKPKTQQTATASPTLSRDDTLRSLQKDDELRRRRGGAADILTGADGAEPAPAGAKALLGQ